MICHWELQLHASLTLRSSSAGTSVSLALSACVKLSQPSLWCSSLLFFSFSLCPHLFFTTCIPTITFFFKVTPTVHVCHHPPHLSFTRPEFICDILNWAMNIETHHVTLFTHMHPLCLCHSPLITPSFPPVSPLQMCEDRGSPVIFSQSVTFSPEWKWNTTCVPVCFHAFKSLYLTTGQPESLADGFPSWRTLRWSERRLGNQWAARHLFQQNKWLFRNTAFDSNELVSIKVMARYIKFKNLFNFISTEWNNCTALKKKNLYLFFAVHAMIRIKISIKIKKSLLP